MPSNLIIKVLTQSFPYYDKSKRNWTLRLPCSNLEQAVARLYTDDDVQVTPHSSDEELHGVDGHGRELPLHGGADGEEEALQLVVGEEVRVFPGDEQGVEGVQVHRVVQVSRLAGNGRKRWLSYRLLFM